MDQLTAFTLSAISIAAVMLAFLAATVWLGWRNSALRHALAWALLATLTTAAVSWAKVFLPVPLPWCYLALVTGLAVPIAIFGARNPGAAAWNFVVVSFLAIGTLPLLEQPWHSPQWRLDSLWLIVLASVLGIGWINYLPTRLAWMVTGLAWSLAWQLAILAAVEYRDILLPVADLCTSVGLWVAVVVGVTRIRSSFVLGKTPLASRGGLESIFPGEQFTDAQAKEVFDRIWLRIRDAWGLVWAWRVREMVQNAAYHARLQGELTWSGLQLPLNSKEASTPQLPLAQPDQQDKLGASSEAPGLSLAGPATSPQKGTLAREWLQLLLAVSRRFAPPI